MNLRERLNSGFIVLDGAMGTLLQKAGLALGELPEEWNLTRPDAVAGVHRAYLAAGSDVIYANTFGANCLKFGDRTEQIVSAGVQIARREAALFKDKFVALDVGPTGKMLKPLGDLGFEQAVEIFKRTVRAGVAAGVDLIAIETMNDVYEMKAAVIAAKEECDLPVFATLVFGKDCKTMTGSTPEAAVALLEGLGVDALGLNCSLAPSEMKEALARIAGACSLPVIAKPNAGLPEDCGGDTKYGVAAEQFAADMAELARLGATVLGGCCGTSPEYISRLIEYLKAEAPKKITQKNKTVACSYSRAVEFGGAPVLIGERINPTGKKRLKQALREGDIPYVLAEAVAQTERGVHALDVNVGLPEIDEPAMLEECVREIQAVTDLPLQIDTSDPVAMERAMRCYNGKPIVNSVNGRAESMQAVFPLVKKYGGLVIALTLDEKGIPSTAEGRVQIAEKIINCAKEWGISRNQLIFDTLAMAVSADGGAANAALGAMQYIRERLGCNTSLGVSNISFGLPNRDCINSTFFAMALSRGLSAAIINPNSAEMIKTYKSFSALSGWDEGCREYIAYAAENVQAELPKTGSAPDLKYCIIKGLKLEAAAECKKLLESLPPLEAVNSQIVPALDEVGRGFEAGTVYLPQLLMSAEAAKQAFAEVKARLPAGAGGKNLKAVLATVKGDIHDIGKNIVATLLENYGFGVIDLGRDVEPQSVADAVKASGAKLVGLSALMTTTVPSMKATVELLREQCKGVKIAVGGAVLNAEYARAIGADRYCRDAMDTVRYAEELNEDRTT